MKKRKIVAVLVAAAMTVTSFLPGSNFIQPVNAAENLAVTVDPDELTFDLDNASTKEVTVKVTSGSSADGSGLAAELKKYVTIKTQSAVTVTSDSGFTYDSNKASVKLNVTPVKWGKESVDIVSGGSSTLKSFTVTVKKSKVGVKVDGITKTDNTLKVGTISYYNPDNTSESIDASFVSAGSLTYKWFSSTSLTGSWTEIKNADGTTYSIPSGTRNTYYKVEVVPKAGDYSKNNSNVATTKEAYSYTKSNSSSTTTSADKNNTSTTTTTTTDPDTGATTTTTTTTTADGTQETTAVTEAADGTKTTTVTEEKPDGSKVETTTVEATDGTKTTTIKEENADGSTKESTEVVNPDGSSTFESKEVKADGTVITVESATTAAGDTKSTEVTTYPAGSSVKVKTVESNVKANGNSVVVTTKENADNTVEIVSDTKNSAGETSVTFEAAAGKSVVTVSEIDTTAKSVTIPNKVTAAGKTYKVTKVGKAAMKGNKTATKITLGKNIKSVAAQAFQGTSKAKNFQIKGNVTTIGKNSFKNINKKATIKITATKKQYKAMVKKIKNAGGAPAKVTFKRVK